MGTRRGEGEVTDEDDSETSMPQREVDQRIEAAPGR
jgi:hypothetical protein